jgi:colanic acid biosynthesis glycosyl transferase WcaI
VSTPLWIVSELYYPEETSTGYLLTLIAEGLAAAGRPVRVLCAQPTYSRRGTRAPAREVRHGVAIQRVAGTTLPKDRMLPRIVNMLTITASIFLAAVRRFRRGDLVLVVTNPPALPFAVALACRLRGARCLLLIHDVYPEVLVASGMAGSGSLITRIVRTANHWLYNAVERVLVLGRDMRDIAVRKMTDGDRRIVLIPNWADVDDVRPDTRATNALLTETSLSGRFVVQYAGNMGRTHGIETLVDAAQRLKKSAPDVSFLFLGSGAKKAWLEQAVRSLGLPNVTILGSRPRSDQHLFINACDVAVISFMPGMAGVSVPSRMYNIMSAGKPIVAVADEHSELARVVREEDIGWVVPPSRPELLEAAIREARADAPRRAAMGERARAAAVAKYRFEAIVGQYESMLAGLAPSP